MGRAGCLGYAQADAELKRFKCAGLWLPAPLTESVEEDGVAETAMIALRRSGGQMRFTRTMIGC